MKGAAEEGTAPARSIDSARTNERPIFQSARQNLHSFAELVADGIKRLASLMQNKDLENGVLGIILNPRHSSLIVTPRPQTARVCDDLGCQKVEFTLDSDPQTA